MAGSSAGRTIRHRLLPRCHRAARREPRDRHRGLRHPPLRDHRPAAARRHDRLATANDGPPFSRDVCPARWRDPARGCLGARRPPPGRGELQSPGARAPPGLCRRSIPARTEREHEVIALIDYGAGNLRSVENALARLNATATIAATPEDLARARAILFPGVGAAAPAMARLRDRGLDRAVITAIRNGVPFLGICLGMQLLFERSAEDGAACLGILPGTVERLSTREKLPHVGRNTLEHVRPDPALAGIERQAFHVVHAYVVLPRHPG